MENMESLKYNDVLNKAKAIGKQLNIDRFINDGGARIIEMQHVDGTYCKFVSACFEEIIEEWIAIYSEHHETVIYHIEDLKWVRESTMSKYNYYNRTLND